MRVFNSKIDSLTIDSLGGRALIVNFFVYLALAIQRISYTSSNAKRHGGGASTFAGAFMMNRTGLLDELVFDVL
jgi:hypothetical protein